VGVGTADLADARPHHAVLRRVPLVTALDGVRFDELAHRLVDGGQAVAQVLEAAVPCFLGLVGLSG
jgi:hypothetical protein